MRLCRGKRPRGARPNKVLVALFLALAMAQRATLLQWARHGFSLFFSACKIDAKRGLKAGICRTRVAGQPQEGSGPTARAF